MTFQQILYDLPNQVAHYWRQRWLVISVAWVIALIGWLVVAMLPDRYQAMTRIYVDTNDLLTPLLRNIAVQSDMQRQIEVLQRTLLNRNNISRVVHAADMDLDINSEADKDALYSRLAKKITIRAEGNNLFTVNYSDPNPQQAKKVVETLLNLFVETNLGQNRKSMEDARNFIEDQIADYEQKLKQADQKLANYKEQHLSLLMATGANFSARIDGARQDATAAKMKFDDAISARDQLKAHLTGVPQYLDVETAPQVVMSGNGANNSASPKMRVRQLENQLSQLQARYTDQHPDVVAVKRELEQARQASATEPGSGTAGVRGNSRIPNPLYEQLMLRLVQADADVAQAQNRLQAAEQEMRHLQGLGASAPKVEADLADLNREYGVIKQKYEELLSRRESARISEAAESRSGKVQFRIIEAPQVPAEPAFPNRPLLVSLVLVVAIAVGMGVAFVLQKLNDTVSSLTDLAEDFNLRVLGVVQKVEVTALATLRRRSLRNFGLASGSLLAGYLVVLILARSGGLPQVGAEHLPDFLQRIRDYGG